MTSALIRRILASHLTVALLVFATFVPTDAAEGSVLTGRVMDSDGFTPREGVVVALVDNDNRLVYRSGPTSEEGAFEIDSAPAGGYKLLAETDDGAFLASNDFKLDAGKNEPVSLKLAPAAPIPTATIAPGRTGGETSWWQWAIAGAIVVTGLLVVSDASESTGSQSTTSN
jgi:hypothetical protein